MRKCAVCTIEPREEDRPLNIVRFGGGGGSFEVANTSILPRSQFNFQLDRKYIGYQSRIEVVDFEVFQATNKNPPTSVALEIFQEFFSWHSLSLRWLSSFLFPFFSIFDLVSLFAIVGFHSKFHLLCVCTYSLSTSQSFSVFCACGKWCALNP